MRHTLAIRHSSHAPPGRILTLLTTPLDVEIGIPGRQVTVHTFPSLRQSVFCRHPLYVRSTAYSPIPPPPTPSGLAELQVEQMIGYLSIRSQSASRHRLGE